MKPDNPKKVIIVYESGTEYHLDVDIQAKEWKQAVLLLFKSGRGGWKISMMERVRLSIKSFFRI